MGGVGARLVGYDAIGIDSGLFPQGLCINIASAARAAASAAVDPKDLLVSGYAQLLKEPGIKGGASTVCFGVYKTDGVLSVAK